jgi:hypothetical protein
LFNGYIEQPRDVTHDAVQTMPHDCGGAEFRGRPYPNFQGPTPLFLFGQQLIKPVNKTSALIIVEKYF